MSSYILRNIPVDLWARVKARSEADGLPLRQIILLLLQHYNEHGLQFRFTKTREP